jgi:hypothetical protein
MVNLDVKMKLVMTRVVTLLTHCKLKPESPLRRESIATVHITLGSLQLEFEYSQPIVPTLVL